MSLAVGKNFGTEGDHGLAPFFDVPNTQLVGVDHPFMIRNPEKAVQSLGGSGPVASLINRHEGHSPARLSLHPTDPFARTIEAGIVHGNNILLRIEVPRRTGRKRKRGSNDPFRAEEELRAPGEKPKPRSGQDRAVQDIHNNADKCKVSVVGHIAQTHRFRDPPDFVWSSKPGGFLQKFEDHLLNGTLEQIRDFRLDPDPRGHELLPAPFLAPSTTPWNYSYRQNVAVKTIEIDGKTVTYNSAAARSLKIYSVKANEPSVPSPSEEDLRASFRTLTNHDRKLVNKIKALFNDRPIWTRRTVRNILRADGIHLVQVEHHVFAQIAYSFLSGPWRDCLVRYGVDPRKDPEMRIYQSLSFRTDDMGRFGSKIRAGPREYTGSHVTPGSQHASSIQPPPELGHVFDGKSVDTKGKLWQLCDITDPLIKSLLATEEVRSSCAVEDSGWYHNGTWGKVRAITKAKMRQLFEHGTPLDDEASPVVQTLLKIPDHITQEKFANLTRRRPLGLSLAQRKKAEQLSAAVRAIVPREKLSRLLPESGGQEASFKQQSEIGTANAQVSGDGQPDEQDDVDEETRDLIDDLEDDDNASEDDDEDENDAESGKGQDDLGGNEDQVLNAYEYEDRGVANEREELYEQANVSS